MKLTQTNNQITIKQSGIGQLVLGLIFLLIGIVVAGLSTAIKPGGASGSPKVLLLVGGLFVVIGLLVTAFAKSQRTVLAKDGTSEVQTRRLIGGHATDQNFPTSQIAKVRLNVYWQRMNGGPNTSNQPQRRSNLSLIMQDQSQLELADAGAGNFSIQGINLSAFMKAPLYSEAERLAGFLAVPLEVGDNGSFSLAGSLPGPFGGNPQTGGGFTPTQTVPPTPNAGSGPTPTPGSTPPTTSS